MKHTSRILLSLILSLFTVTSARAHENEVPKDKVDGPADRYNGSAPIDIHHGLLFNNGTYGQRNPEYEDFSSSLVMPGLSQKNYPFTMKESFVDALNDRVDFFAAAIENWKTSTALTKPEVKEYADKAIATMSPLLAHLREVTQKAASASSSDWDAAQADARRVLAEARSTYMGMHHNVIR